jgi:hypothetical protein
MIRLAFAAVLFMTSAAHAGTLTFSYANTAGSTVYSATAAVTDADAGTFVSWCQAHFTNPGPPVVVPTAQQCFYDYADWVFARLRNDVLQAAQAVAVTTTVPITVTPAQ